MSDERDGAGSAATAPNRQRRRPHRCTRQAVAARGRCRRSDATRRHEAAGSRRTKRTKAERKKKTKKRERPRGRVATRSRSSCNYLQQVVAELRKVIWPNRKQMVTYTTVVLVFLAFMVALIGLVDLGLAKLVMLVFG